MKWVHHLQIDSICKTWNIYVWTSTSSIEGYRRLRNNSHELAKVSSLINNKWFCKHFSQLVHKFRVLDQSNGTLFVTMLSVAKVCGTPMLPRSCCNQMASLVVAHVVTYSAFVVGKEMQPWRLLVQAIAAFAIVNTYLVWDLWSFGSLAKSESQ